MKVKIETDDINAVAKRLAAEVLKQALEDYRDSNSDEVKLWFQHESREPFGFYWCLEHSEVNPNLVRKFLKQCDETKSKKRNRYVETV